MLTFFELIPSPLLACLPPTLYLRTQGTNQHQMSVSARTNLLLTLKREAPVLYRTPEAFILLACDMERNVWSLATERPLYEWSPDSILGDVEGAKQVGEATEGRGRSCCCCLLQEVEPTRRTSLAFSFSGTTWTLSSEQMSPRSRKRWMTLLTVWWFRLRDLANWDGMLAPLSTLCM